MQNIYELKFEYLCKLQGGVPEQDFDDIFQKSIIILHNNVEKANDPKAFLYETIKREVISWKGTKYYKKTEYVETEEELYEYTGNEKLLREILNKIEELPEKTRIRLKEYLFQEKTIFEIAKDNNLNYDTTKATIRRGLEILQKRLKKWKD